MSTDKKTYHGSCHCGAVKFDVEYVPLEKTEIVSCNCSICTRNGYLFIYPKTDEFKLLSGSEVLKTYQFNKKRRSHRFCGDCGNSVFSEWHNEPIVGVNVRTFSDIDISSLKLKYLDRKNG